MQEDALSGAAMEVASLAKEHVAPYNPRPALVLFTAEDMDPEHCTPQPDWPLGSSGPCSVLQMEESSSAGRGPLLAVLESMLRMLHPKRGDGEAMYFNACASSAYDSPRPGMPRSV